MDKQRRPMKTSNRLLLRIGSIFVIAGIIIVALVNNQARKQALVEAETKAQIILNRNLATHTYFTHQLKPKLFKLTGPISSDAYFEPTWMSSTYAVREIDKYFKFLEPGEYYYKECAINARRPENEADAYEKLFIEELNANSELMTRSVKRVLNAKPYFVVLHRGEVMEESCLRCHSTPEKAPGDLVRYYGPERSFNRKIGEVVSANSIRVPLSTAYVMANRFSLRLSIILLTVLGVLFFLQYWFNKLLVFKPLSTIHQKALLISNSDEHLGEEIPLPPSRELNELTEAFNKMSIGLRHHLDHLEGRVQDRTSELTRINNELKNEIEKRKKTEEALVQARNELEQRVTEGTAELSKANQQLVRKIEDHKQMGKKLKQAERKYRTIADYTYDWEYWAHFDGTFHYVSPSCERISGYTAQEFMDNPSLFREIIVPEDRGIWDEHYSDSREELGGRELQFRIQKRNGEIRWIEHACQPAYDEQGKPLGFRASNRDITMRKQMEKMSQSLRDELAHMNRVLSMGALTSAIAHEINQPLAAILSNTQAALRFLDHEDPDLDEVREALVDIVQDDKRAAEVIRRLRRMVKKEEPVHESFHINAVVEASIHLLDTEIMFQNISVVKGLKSGIPALYGDPIQIQQVIINLLTNAMDAMKDRPKDSRRVLLSTRSDRDKGVAVTVIDTGPGLTTDQIETVFNPFYTTKTEGLGLGLSVCRSIIQAHEGHIQVENGPDGGAMFTFWIPFGKEVS